MNTHPTHPDQGQGTRRRRPVAYLFRESVQCEGFTIKGRACQRRGFPRYGAKRWWCRHHEDQAKAD